MSDLIWRTDSAYDFPLLVKNMLAAPLVDDPEQEIVYRGELRFTYRQFRERVGRLAAALRYLGIGPGDTVAVMDWDSHRFLECFYAVPMIGAVLHTVNVRLSPEQLVYTIGHAEDDILLINAELLPLLEHIKSRIDTVKQFVLMSDDGLPATSLEFAGEYEELLAACEPVTEFPDFDENTRATTFYSTGHAPACPRASTSATASSSCTPSPRWPRSPRPTRGACAVRTSTCRSRRCSTCTPGASPTSPP